MNLTYPRRQQLRRLRGALARGGQGALALAAALVLAAAGATPLGLAATALAGVLLADGARTLRLARRSAIGAMSEARVRAALEPLRAEGWAVGHGAPWPGGGDIDHVVRSPTGTGFAIETKTRRYTEAQLARTAATALWLARRRRRYPCGVVAVMCIATARSRSAVERDVLVVSLDRLLSALRATAATTKPPRRTMRPGRAASSPRRAAARP